MKKTYVFDKDSMTIRLIDEAKQRRLVITKTVCGFYKSYIVLYLDHDKVDSELFHDGKEAWKAFRLMYKALFK